MRRVAIAIVLAGIFALQLTSHAAPLNAVPARALNSEISNINLIGVSFADAIDYLRDISGANINVNWRLLHDKNITKDAQVHVRLRAVPMRKALQLILDEAGGSTPLTYYLDQGVIEITTQEAADAKLITRVYDVGDLIVDIPNFAGPNLNLAENSNSSNSGSGSNGNNSGGGGSGLFSNTGNSKTDEKTATANDRGNDLVSIITTTIRPEVWQINGGTATIRFFRNRLIVTAPRSVQEMIGGRVQ